MKRNIQRKIHKISLRGISLAIFLAFGAAAMTAQNSLPAPGSGGSCNPAPSRPVNGIGWNPGPPPPSSWGRQWGGPGWYNSPSEIISNSYPNWNNQGSINVMACGYDVQGVWRNLPLHVAYTYNGVNYDVTVINAWNPWTDMWDHDVDRPAYNTSYYINGNTYDFYTALSTGTYYFNL